MRKWAKRAIISVGVLALIVAFLLWPGLPWSTRNRHMLKRAMTKVEIQFAQWRGHTPRQAIVTGRLVAGGEAMRGVEVAAIESPSGYLAMSNDDGSFILPHLLWYPEATYNLIITTQSQARQVKIRFPSAYPSDGLIDAGEVPFESGEELAKNERLDRYLRYDRNNCDYYRKLFRELTSGSQSDHQKIDAINRFIASRHKAKETRWQYDSARQIIEHGAPHCSNLAFAMAALTGAGGYPSRVVHISDTPDYQRTHTMVEVYYAEGWHLYDPTYGVFFLNREGAVACYKEMRLEPDIISAKAFVQARPDQAREALAWMAGSYSSGFHQTYLVALEDFSDCP
jgi:hypothetical protein